MREFDSQGYHVRLDLSRQVLGIDAPDEHGFGQGQEEAPISPTLQGLDGGFVSASMLAQKAKQFDDGLYAAVELAAQNGAGRFGGKAVMLQALARALTADVSGNGPDVVLAACRLGNVAASVPDDLRQGVESTVQEFLANPLRSKPIGFYTWSEPLSDIFRQDRMLQSELKGRPGIEAVVRALHGDSRARAIYEAYLTLISGLTNPLKYPDLRGPLQSLDRGSLAAPDKEIYIVPPSRSHESDLVMRLYGGRPIPAGFSLVDEVIKRIRSGELDLKPTAESGWYDYQTWSIEPLVTPEKTPEASRLQLSEAYQKQLLNLFKGILALTRETHVKQLELPAPGAAALLPGEKQPVVIRINPELNAEPLSTFYQRRADSYRFVKTVLAETFGADALRQSHRLTASGPVRADLLSELDQVEALFYGASAKVDRQLGVARQADPKRTAAADVAAFERWSGSVASDSDVARDARMMVPIFYDRDRKLTKVWVFLGWANRPVNVWFATPPTAEVTRNGQKTKPGETELSFETNYHRVSYPVTAEVYVSAILNRDEFRRHCDQYKTRSAILKNLR